MIRNQPWLLKTFRLIPPIYPRKKSLSSIITKEGGPTMKLHNRQIKASYWSDTDMIRNFALEERLFYIGLWQLADDSGCIENDPYAFKLFLFPLNEEVTIETLNDWTAKLIEKQKLIPYHVQGKDGLYLANFHKHQTIKNPQPPEVPLPPWITWKPYKSNPRTGRYEIRAPQDHQEIQHSKDTQEIQCPHEIRDYQDLQVSHNHQDPQDSQNLENSSNLNHSFSSSGTFLTACLQDKYKENLNRNKKEREEGRDCQGKGKDLSANAESRSVLKGENKYVKDLKDLEVINPKPNNSKPNNHQTNNTKPKTHSTNPVSQTIMDFYNQEFQGLWKGPLRLTRERERQIKARLKSFTVEELKTAITNLRQSAFHCGNNDKERVYGTPEYLFKNDSQVDKWLNEKAQKKFKSRDEVWKEYLAQNPTLNSNWLGV
jgi:hypothetical protein